MNERTTPTGLSTAEVAERTRQGQVNRVRQSDFAQYRDIVFRNLFTLFNALVVPAAVALFVLGELQGAFAVSGMAAVNTILGLAQELKAKRHLDHLALLAEARVRVLRDAKEAEIPSGDVVLGEAICLRSGEPIVADGAVLEANFLEVDEALLTGESDPVPRKPGDEVMSGSMCVAGEGLYRADRVGAASFAQSTASEARAYSYVASPMQLGVNQIIRILSATAVALCLLYVGLTHIRDNISHREVVKMTAATITSMVPQGLVLMVTLAFLLGAVRMSRRGAVVQRLAAVETMASVDVLCMDKTGTLTTNRLRVERIHRLANAFSDDEVHDRLRLLAAASIDRQNKSIQALVAALGETAVKVLDQIPFKSQNRFSAVRVRSGKREHTLVLGAPEAIGARLDAAQTADWETTLAEQRKTGLRLLLFAESTRHEPFNGSLDGFPLQALALVALSDELRPEAGGVLQHLASQGIRFKILSGDNAETVRATVATLDLPLAHEPVVSGDQLAAADNADELIRERSVFGRVSPRQKLDIVGKLQQQGCHVAMIGDGVNDVLPIKKADLGIAMGEGSKAARTVAGLVLENNNFELLPDTLEEGRTILRNLRRSSKLFLLKNVYTFILILGFVCCGVDFPYEPQQVTLLNFLTIGIPALVITLSRERSTMATKTRFLREVGSFVFRSGIVIGVAGVLLMLWTKATWPSRDDEDLRGTLLLSFLVIVGLSALLRTLGDGEVQSLHGDRRFRWFAAAALPVYGIAVYWSPTATFFHLTPLTLGQWGIVLLFAAGAIALCHATDWWVRPAVRLAKEPFNS